jgi:ubiquinol-cytochrome c reductase iron-sulfur subunit
MSDEHGASPLHPEPRIGDEVPIYQPKNRPAAIVEDAPVPPTGSPGSGEAREIPPRGIGAIRAKVAAKRAATPPQDPQDRFNERLVASVFLLSAAGAITFVIMYAIHAKPTDNWINGWLGGSLGVSLLALGSGAVLWAKLLMPHEEAVEERHPFNSDPADQQSAADSFNAGVAGSGIARRPLLRRSLLLAAGVVGLPGVVLLRSLGPRPKGELAHTDWTAGARMVDQFNNPILAAAIQPVGAFFTVFPENHTDPDSAASSAVMLINVGAGIRPQSLAKSYNGILAYSKICTHAGCPTSLYDQQTHTLLCPCHQSQFKVLEGCKPVAGPATRSLPQLGITVDDDGYLIATGDFNEPIGPGFWERKS